MFLKRFINEFEHFTLYVFQECFTRVLKGHISLAATVFPNGVKGNLFVLFKTTFAILCFYEILKIVNMK